MSKTTTNLQNNQLHSNMAYKQADPIQTHLGGTLHVGDQQHQWSLWHGQQLGKHIAMDTETTLIQENLVPELCMVSISDGRQHYVVKPEQIAELLIRHLPGDHSLAFHNAAFDFSVIDRYLHGTGASDARNWLWSAVDQRRVHDTMLLSALVTLAQSDDDRMLSLADAVQRWCGFELAKDGYRMRFAETVGQDWATLDAGFFKYAVADAIATWQLFAKLTHVANQITTQHGLPKQFGYLTESLQVKAAISLTSITRNGLQIDLQRADELRKQIDVEIQQAITTMGSVDHDLWHRYKKTGAMKINRETGLPKMNQTVLLQHLTKIAAELQLVIPTTGKGKPTTSVKRCWCQFRELHLLIDGYCQYTQLTKLRTFFAGLQRPRIHPKYRTMVRTGRTSCSSPNIQQLPRSSAIREAILARPGNLLFIIDYNSLELRTLATVCHQQIGFSRLRDVLIEGTDPHSYAAAMFAGVTLDEFNELPDKKQLRQRAKVFNFGLPAGFGAAALVSHAKFSYGVEMTQDDAELFIELLTKKVYPELGLYLAQDTFRILANALHADPVEVRAIWPEPYGPGMLRKTVTGNAYRADGTPYRPETVERIWQQLEGQCNNPNLMQYIRHRDTSVSSPLRRLLHSSVSTTSGRMRGGVPFTAAKNAPFQGLAADGCKQAMWNLTVAGYRIVAFIHDEFIIELKKTSDIDKSAADIERMCRESMQPFVPGIPVPCEYALTERWHKGAEAVYDDAGHLQVWKPLKQAYDSDLSP